MTPGIGKLSGLEPQGFIGIDQRTPAMNTINTATMSDEGTSRLKWVLLLAAGALLGFAAIEVLNFTFLTVTTLIGASLVSTIMGKYRVSIPGTRIEFHPRAVTGFWGAMWLGISGGIILGMIASIVERSNERQSMRIKVQHVAGDVVAAAVSSLVYVVALGHFKETSAVVELAGILIPNEVIFASLLMGLSYMVVDTAIVLSEGHFSEMRESAVAESIGLSFQGCLVSVFTAIVLFLAFNHFGIEFGIVLIPLAIFGNLAYKIHTRSLEQKTRQITESSRMHLATVEALATAIDARDQVGVGHVRRTQIYAVGIASTLGLSEDEINAIRMGALLHDIGKLAIPDHILNKPGRLTPAELDKTKIHSTVGASILATVGFPYPVVPTVKYHHESWDGTGYPIGLKGEEIPITARILTVADIFDTLREARPYRAAVARDAAIEFLQVRAGTQFDPAIVEVLIRNLQRFEDEIAAAGLTYNQESTMLTAFDGDGETAPHFVEQIKRANHEVFMLYSLAKDFSGSLNLDETLSLFTQKIAEFVPYDTCIVYLLDESGTTATATLAEGLHGADLKGRRVSVGEGATGYALKKLQPVGNVDPVLDFAFSNTEIGRDFTSMMCVPLVADEKVIGAISLYSSKISNYQDEHIRLVDTVSTIAADAIEKALKHAEAQSYALTDPMTGLPNSRSLQVQFDKEVERASRTGTTFQLLVLDVDGFKTVNDSFGHKVGDNLLKEIGRIVREQMREYDFLARYGGDEFVALVPDTDPADAKRLQRRIEDAVSSFALPVGDSGFAQVGISLGSASYPSQGELFDELIVAADKAMYLTKAINRQRSFRRLEEQESKAAASAEPAEAEHTASDLKEREPDLILFSDSEMMCSDADETHVLSSAAVN
jgi:diguanylate cyclase (GGDEF)-like protein/putative nucleotidyltransferase with HDIG domain